ncbi:hypothetical protein M0D21_19630 [Aquimarina sp. D1M17]|uniref:helix-turn-helix transcriptional regulator n=1 Tax=Aquimarina acroporae TaxID=2937283 RepID=UPI0020BFE603|nr:hypothetical protein [Aquimarina acroporae]MCK8523802.1 hypothetical protein [Aquimarina acroporae]
MIAPLLVFTIFDFSVTLLIIALVGIGYLQFKNYMYRSTVKKLKEANLILEQKLTVKEEELKKYRLDRNRQSLLHENIVHKLKEEVVNTINSEEAQKLCLLTAQLQFQIAYEKRLSEAPQKIREVNPSFESKLEIVYPELTNNEREVCTLFLLKLSIGEIMKIRNMSLEVIESMCNQIRSKMNIPSGIRLEQFIQELA